MGTTKTTKDDMFAIKILFTDEATFTNNGQVNLRNMHYWSVENSHWMREVDKQRPWSINVWASILNDKIIDLHFIDGPLNSRKYAQILTEILPLLLEDLPLNVRQSMLYQQDGCPAHSARIITELLNRKFGDCWIGRSGYNRPARSPDLTLMDFYLWGKLKQQVYSEMPTTREDMKERIRRA
ncbi:PREDICTED: uncharacterized protein LOC108774573 [Cyphomyrmex costatus]|uniref:uncharacterized protein LOC108774573 n=1 Tax=Cyphomyrmex costatus TaxID=456900 RepID=UPI00085245EF|nr:PREDICTED: uncharacterized protein LOC108774573 [Cyphomyrmex costatus]